MSSVEFVAVGTDESGYYMKIYSEDGKNWTGVVDEDYVADGLGVAYSPVQDLWVGVGRGTGDNIMYSEDGKNWTGVADTFSIAGRGVAYSPVQDLWVAVGSGAGGDKIMYSEDGKNWTGVPNTFTGSGNGVASKSSIFVPQLH